MEIDFLREEERMWTGRVAATLGLARLETLLSWNELPSRTRGAIEIAFDNEYGDIIVEVIAAKICRSVIDIDHEVLGGKRRTAAHCRGKALQAEFFAKPVLCFGDAICIENQNIAGHEIFRGQVTNLFWR